MIEPTDNQLAALADVCKRAGDDPWSSGGIADDVWPFIARAAWNYVAQQLSGGRGCGTCEGWGNPSYGHRADCPKR